MKKELLIANRRIHAYIPDTGNVYPVIYMHLDRETEAEEIWKAVGDDCFIFICILDCDWNNDMSPWPMPNVYKGEKAFGGNASTYLALLTQTIVPEVEKNISCDMTERCLLGYSLSGIFALYALYNSDSFQRIGSMSGSMWYENWLDYMRSNQPKATSPKVYLSLGDKEKSVRIHGLPQSRTVLGRRRVSFDCRGLKSFLSSIPGITSSTPSIASQKPFGGFFNN